MSTQKLVGENALSALASDIKTAINGKAPAYTEITGTLAAGQTSIVLSNASITSTSTIDYYTEYFGVNPTNISVETGKVTLFFEAQGVSVGVKVRVS